MAKLKAKNKELIAIVRAIFESRYLKKIQRSGTSLILGNAVTENVAEHSYYATLIAMVMHHLDPKLDFRKLVIMCLIHDLEEVRTGDLNWINRLYYIQDHGLEAFSDMWKGSHLGEELTKIHHEREVNESQEAVTAQDCDTLAEILTEKEYLEKECHEAEEWIPFHLSRLKTEAGQEIAKVMLDERSSIWWEEIKNCFRKKHGMKAVNYG